MVLVASGLQSLRPRARRACDLCAPRHGGRAVPPSPCSWRACLWPLNTHSPWGKLKQIARAIQLELFYSKRQILEAYLNDAPYGRNVEGVGAASLAYFDKPVGALTLPEALTLAVIPQDPARHVRATARNASGFIGRRLTRSRDRLYWRWLRSHPEDAALKPLFALPMTMKPVVRAAVRGAARGRTGAGSRANAAGGDPRVVTTIDLDLQRLLERQIGRYIARNASNGIRNASAILVDTRDMGIKALVGSANYLDRGLQGQVNGTLARRSPGSTLKPFIYALGFDQGILHPQTVLRDVPTSFGPYTPENFDGRFLGPITATDALNRSRNIPAVWVASQLHAPDLYQFLQSAGIGHMASEEHYGLALVLGGGEVSMQELAGLYAMLANRGELKPLRLRASDPRRRGHAPDQRRSELHGDGHAAPACPPGRKRGRAAAACADLLEDRHVLGISRRLDGGSFGPYVLVVWVGNFDGSGNPAFVGVDAAAPLFFQIIDGVEAEHPDLREPSAVLLPISSAWRFVWPAATCPITGARRKGEPGSFPANRRSASATCIGR